MQVRTRSREAVAVATIGAAALIFCAGAILGSRLPSHRPTSADADLIARVNHLAAEIAQLHTQPMAAADIVAASRNSICFIVSTYTLAENSTLPPTQYRALATGFLISGNTVVSNRHVLEPWFGDAHADMEIGLGAIPRRGKILAYFPGVERPMELSHVEVSQTVDVATAHVSLPAGVTIAPLRLAAQAANAGEPVLVMGYPLGVTAMLAKTASVPYQISALRQSGDQEQVEHLAHLRLIRPTATQGHLADASGTTLIYDASTAHGSSGGPVFNMRGEVIGVNAALINGFNGTSLGVSSEALRPLLIDHSR